jgi:hypothetical protein
MEATRFSETSVTTCGHGVIYQRSLLFRNSVRTAECHHRDHTLSRGRFGPFIHTSLDFKGLKMNVEKSSIVACIYLQATIERFSNVSDII